MKRLLNKRSILSALLAAACTAAAFGATFTWTALGDAESWTDGDNWSSFGSGNCVYPCDTADDAVIPVKSGGGDWGDIFFDTPFNDPDLTIDDMTILDSVDFKGDGHNPKTLTVDSLTIDASDDDITVTFRRVFELIAN